MGPKSMETAQFVSMFDKFFDCLDVSNFTAEARQRKRFLHPYRSQDGEQLKVHVLYNSHYILLIAVVYSIIVVKRDFSCILGLLGEIHGWQSWI